MCDTNVYHSFSHYNTCAEDCHCWLIFNILKSTITNVHGYFQRAVQNAPVPRVEMLCTEGH